MRTVRRGRAIAAITGLNRTAALAVGLPVLGVCVFMALFARANVRVVDAAFAPRNEIELLVALARSNSEFGWVAMIVSIGALLGAVAGPIFGSLQFAPDAGGATLLPEATWRDSPLVPLLQRWAVASLATVLVTFLCCIVGIATMTVTATDASATQTNIVVFTSPPTRSELAVGLGACLASALAHTAIALVVAAGWGPAAGYGASAGLYVTTLSLRQVPETDALLHLLPGAKELDWLEAVTGGDGRPVSLFMTPLIYWILSCVVLVVVAARRWAPASLDGADHVAGMGGGVLALGSTRNCLVVPKVVVRPGDFTVVIGATGAGKTSFLRALTGQRRLQQGSRSRAIGSKCCWLDGEAVLAPNRSARRAIEATVAAVTGIRIQPPQLDEAAIVLGAAELLRKTPSKLSHGERQLCLLLAGCLIAPDLLVLDEAFDAIDSERRNATARSLINLLPDHASIVAASHVASLLVVADTVITIQAGIVSTRDANDLRRRLVVRLDSNRDTTVPVLGSSVEDLEKALSGLPENARIATLDLDLSSETHS